MTKLKKEYTTPKIKLVKLKHRTNLLQDSVGVNYNDGYGHDNTGSLPPGGLE